MAVIQRGLFLAATLAACIFVARVDTAQAVDFFWNAPALSGEWSDVDVQDTGLTNWSLSSGGPQQGAYPDDASDHATIDLAGSGVLIDGASISVGEVTLSATVATLRVLSTSQSTSLSVLTNDFDNSGTVVLDSSGGATPTLTVSGTTFENRASGVIRFAAPDAGESAIRNFGATVNNHGIVDVQTGADVRFNRTGATATNHGDFSIASGATLTFGSGSIFTQQAGTLDVQGTVTLVSDTFNFNGGNITGNAVNLTSSTLNIGPGSSGTGTFDFFSSSNTLDGDVAAAQTLNVAGAGQAATVAAADSFTNDGRINLTTSGGGSPTLIVSTGTLTNAAQIVFQTGTGASDIRTLSANLLNNDTLRLEAGTDVRFNKTGATTTNRGTLTILPTAVLTFGSGSIFTQQTGTLDVQGTITLVSDTFNFDGGNITGNAVNLRSSTLNIGPGSTGTGTFDFFSSSNTLDGDVAAAQTLNVAGTGQAATVAAADSFTNNGRINLTTSGGGSPTLIVSAGTLTNDEQIVFQTGTGASDIRTLSANLLNNDTLRLEAGTDVRFSKAGATTTNRGTLTILPTATLTFGSGSIFTQQAGTLDVQGTITLVSDTFNFDGGNLAGNAVHLTSSTLNIGPNSTGTGTFNFFSSSNTLDGDVAAAQTLNVAGAGQAATVAAADSFTNNGRINLTTSGGGSPTLIVSAGTLTNDAQIVFQTGTGASDIRTLSANLLNNDTLRLEADTDVRFNKTGATTTNRGTLTILPTATLTFGSGSIFTQQAGTLDVQGTIALASDTFNFDGGNITGNVVNLTSSTLNIGPGSTGTGTFNFHSSSNTLDGDVAAAQTLNVAGGGQAATVTAADSFTNNGRINLTTSGGGSPTLIVSTAALTNNGRLAFETGTGASHIRTLSADLDNAGDVTLLPTTDVRWTKTGATYNNAGTVTILEDAELRILGGGTRVFNNHPGGRIEGIGTFDIGTATFNGNGTVAPGLSPGVLTFDGLYHQGATGELEVEIGGLLVGDDYDRLVVDGDANLDGTLTVRLLGGYQPGASDQFTILTADAVQGTFANTPGNVVTFPGGSFDVLYNSDSVVLTNYQIPEPSTGMLAVWAIGALLGVTRRRRVAT